MAILNDVPGIEINICVDGQLLNEYSDDEDGLEAGAGEIEVYRASRTVPKYVESTTGKEFSIRLSVKGSYVMDCEVLAFTINIDGQWIRTALLTEPTFKANKRNGGWTKTLTGVEVKRNPEQNTSTIRTFVFSAVGTSNENDQPDRIQIDSKHMARVGLIEVIVERENDAVPIVGAKTLRSNIFDEKDIKNVHEKALKGSAKSHGTSLGASTQSTPITLYTTTPIDPLRPLAVFQFKYRSKKALQTLLVLPRTPEPEVDVDDLTEDQRKQVEEFKRSLLAGGGPSRVKRENAASSSSGRDTKKARTAEIGKGKGKAVVYDLTGDSD